MASKDEIDRLIAEADAALSARPAKTPASRPSPTLPPEEAAARRVPRRFESSVRVSAVSGGVATFIIVLGQRITRRK